MTQKNRLLKFAQEHDGIILTKQLDALQIGRWALRSLEQEGKIFQVQRGVYVTEHGYADEFFLLQHRYPQGVFSHETALYLLGFSDRIPTEYVMTFIQGVSTVRMHQDNVRAVTTTRRSVYAQGIIEITRSGGTTVRSYCIERTLCDLLRPRYEADLEQVIPAIKRYAASKSSDFSKLEYYAELLGIEEKMHEYMAVLL